MGNLLGSETKCKDFIVFVNSRKSVRSELIHFCLLNDIPFLGKNVEFISLFPSKHE